MTNRLNQIKAKLIGELVLAQHLDELSMDLLNLKDMSNSNEIDLFLENHEKKVAQQTVYIQKIIDSLKYSRLRHYLQRLLNIGELEQFKSQNLDPFIKDLKKELVNYEIVKLQVAVEFTAKDLKDMSAALEKKIGKPVVLDLTIDKSLIGGAIVQYGSYISDHSIKANMIQFQEKWEQAVTDSKK